MIQYHHLVHNSAIVPNFTLVSSPNPNSSKLSNGSNKSVIEGCVVRGKKVHNFSRSLTGKQRLIRGEQALSLPKVLVINVIKCKRCGWVHVNGDSRVNIFRAHFLELLCVCRIECWINSVSAFEAVNPMGEPAAV